MNRQTHTISTIILLFLILISCQRNKQPENKGTELKYAWTEDQKWNYFRDSIANRMYNGTIWYKGDSLNNYTVFSKIMFSDIKAKNISDPLIYGLQEGYIDTTKIDSTRDWFRITVNPCFRIPYCIILEKKKQKTYLTLKLTDGNGGYYCGTLKSTFEQVFSDSLYNSISKTLDSLNFWKLTDDTTCKGGCDGESWTLERLEKGKYNIVFCWLPTHCGNSTTHKLGQIGVSLIEKTKMLDFISLTTGINRKTLEGFY